MYKSFNAIVLLAVPSEGLQAVPKKIFELISEAEQKIAKSFVYFEDKMAYCVAHAMVRKALATHINLPPSKIPIVSTEKGKPVLAPHHPLADRLHFNISHTRALVGCILAPTACGIDIAIPTQRIPTDTLSADENRFIQHLPPWQRPVSFAQIWAVKEAFVKAVGSGLPENPAEIETRISASSILVTYMGTVSSQCHTTLHSHQKGEVAMVTRNKIPICVEQLVPPFV